MRYGSLILSGLAFLGTIALIQSCSPSKGNETGHEYMQDMGHSIAYEANVDGYYYYNTWGTHTDYKHFAGPRIPVKGTIARGAIGFQNALEHGTIGEYDKLFQTIPANGSMPYYYGDTEEERLRAMKEIIKNPIPLSANSLSNGKALFEIYCGVCHGSGGGGNGPLYDGPDAKYPAAPANLVNDDFCNASNGRFYHAIMYGKNVMGGYSDKLSYTERWDVIHYIRSLQAKTKNWKYSPTEMTHPNAGTSVNLTKSEEPKNHEISKVKNEVESSTHHEVINNINH